MKKITALLTALALLLGACALAFTGSGYPAWDGAAAPQNSFCGVFGGDSLRLDFDSDPKYSSVLDGMITACFFAFDSAEQNYLEMYLMLPENAAAGDVYSSSVSGDRSSISLYEVSLDGEDLYFAGQLMGAAYPGGTGYEIRIEDVQRGETGITLKGSMNARLCKIVNSYVTDDFLTLDGAAFQFTVALQNGSAPAADPSVPPQASANPDDGQPPFGLPAATPTPLPDFAPFAKKPSYTMDPHPAFTLPPDYRVI